MSRNAGHSYSANNIVFINESLTATSALKKGDSIVSDIKIDRESINAKWAYGIVIDPDNGSETCLLSGNTIEFRGNNTISGAFSLIVIGSYE